MLHLVQVPAVLVVLVLAALLALAVCIWRGLVQTVRAMAWKETCITARWDCKNGKINVFEPRKMHAEVKRQRHGFVGRSPGYGFRGIHQALVHQPAFLYQLVHMLVWKLPLFVTKCLVYQLTSQDGRWERPPTDEEIYRFLTETPMYQLVRLQEDGERVIMDFEVPEGTGLELQARGAAGAVVAGSALHLRMDASSKCVLKATILDRVSGDRVAVSTLANLPGSTVNDLLLSAMHLIGTTWLHPLTHVKAEQSAVEIAMKGVRALEPSSRFVESLHEGLLYEPLSPISDWNHPLQIDMYVDPLRSTVEKNPNPPRVANDALKLAHGRAYLRFMEGSRRILESLVKDFSLDVDTDLLFHNLIAHCIEHLSVYEVLDSMNLGCC